MPNIEDFYHRHEGALAMLSTLPGASRDLPAMTAGEYVAATPFMPYHPVLIQAIFGSVKSATATGFALNPEARSMIGMAQGVLSHRVNGFVTGELGRVVSLDMVYDQIAVDLQPQDRREIEGLPDQLPGYHELAQRVLKALYLLQAVPWIAVTADTLAHALLRDVRTENVATLRGQTEERLQQLQAARYVVAKEDDSWEFLTGAKKNFEEEVAAITVRQVDRRRTVRSMLGEVLRPVGKLNYKEGLRTFDVVVRGDGEELKSGHDITLDVYSPLHVKLEDGFNLQDLEQIISFSTLETVYWVAAESSELSKQLTRSIRLEDILAKWKAKSSKTDEEREIIREKETELSALRSKIESALRAALINGTIVWNGRAEELDGRTTTLNPIFNRHLGQVVPHVYPKFDLAAVKPNEDEIKAVLTVAPYALATVGAGLDLFGQDGHLNQHSAVVAEVRRELEQRSNRGQELDGKSIEEHFSGGDYGWHPVVIRLVLAAMFRAGMISVKAENVHYTDHSAPAAQTLLTRSRPFRRAVFFYEAEEAVEPGELRRAQDELKLIFEVQRREETANVLAEQIQQEMKRWNERAGRLMLQLRPASYPISETLAGSQTLHYQVTRFSNPGKIVKAFLENLDAVREWHTEVQTLNSFIHEKRLPVFQQARKLLTEVEQAEGVPGAESLAEQDALGWRERLEQLVSSGRAAYDWGQFVSALTALSQRFRQIYQEMHERRQDVHGQVAADLRADDIDTDDIDRYACEGFVWDEGTLQCQSCAAAPETLDLHIRLIPAEGERLRRLARDEQAGYTGETNIKFIQVAKVLSKRRIQHEDELDETLSQLRATILKALQDADIVELT